MPNLKEKGQILVGIFGSLGKICISKGGVSARKMSKKIGEWLEAVSLDKKSLKIISDDLTETLKGILDDGSKFVIQELITRLPKEAKIKVLETLSAGDRKKLSAFSEEMKNIIEHYEKLIEAQSRLRINKIETVDALRKFCLENDVNFDESLQLIPPEAEVIGIRYKDEVRFSVKTGNYDRGKILVSVPTKML